MWTSFAARLLGAVLLILSTTMTIAGGEFNWAGISGTAGFGADLDPSENFLGALAFGWPVVLLPFSFVTSARSAMAIRVIEIALWFYSAVILLLYLTFGAPQVGFFVALVGLLSYGLGTYLAVRFVRRAAARTAVVLDRHAKEIQS